MHTVSRMKFIDWDAFEIATGRVELLTYGAERLGIYPSGEVTTRQVSSCVPDQIGKHLS